PGTPVEDGLGELGVIGGVVVAGRDVGVDEAAGGELRLGPGGARDAALPVQGDVREVAAAGDGAVLFRGLVVGIGLQEGRVVLDRELVHVPEVGSLGRGGSGGQEGADGQGEGGLTHRSHPSMSGSRASVVVQYNTISPSLATPVSRGTPQ